MNTCPSCNNHIEDEEELEFLGWHGVCPDCEIQGVKPEEEDYDF